FWLPRRYGIDNFAVAADQLGCPVLETPMRADPAPSNSLGAGPWQGNLGGVDTFVESNEEALVVHESTSCTIDSSTTRATVPECSRSSSYQKTVTGSARRS